MNEVLVDTSVWVNHFRHCNESLVDFLSLEMAMTHPMVVAELACGKPPAPRERKLADIATLPQSRQATLVEVRELIELENLFGLDCGLVDLTLMASTMLTTGERLWTLGQRLRRLADRLQVAYLPARH